MRKSNDITQLRAGGGVLYKKVAFQPKVLLMKRNGFWDLPKGKLDADESIEECAIREVEEEVGARGVSIEKFLCDTYHEFEKDGKKYGKKTTWYSMKFIQNGSELKPETDEGITEVRWVELQKAKKMVEFENLADVLNAFQRQQNLSQESLG